MRGIIYVAYGERARTEAAASIASLRQSNDLPVGVVGEAGLAGARHIPFDHAGPGARWAKLNVDKLAPWDNVAYLDADTRVNADLSVGFDILDDGWDMVIVPSQNQDNDLLWHIGQEERDTTFEEIGNVPLQLQAGIFWFRKSESISKFFELWREEWRRWGDQDQAALLRALARQPLKVWLFGRPWNGGGLIAHLFGRIRRG